MRTNGAYYCPHATRYSHLICERPGAASNGAELALKRRRPLKKSRTKPQTLFANAAQWARVPICTWKQYLYTWKWIHLRCTNNFPFSSPLFVHLHLNPLFGHLHIFYWISKILLLVTSAKLARALITSNDFVPCGWAWMHEITAENCSHSFCCWPMSFWALYSLQLTYAAFAP